MRTLVLQLARFGDIYQTHPVLNALKRLNPGGELHVMTRARFKAALDGFPDIHLHTMNTADILKPVIEDGDETISLSVLQTFIEQLRAIGFDRIINLSFSPASSYLTDAIATESTVVSGYTRQTDGFLKIPDDPSAYFYAQVGVGRANRYHLTEVFAAVAGVELIDEDWGMGRRGSKHNQIVVHLGASTRDKIYPAEKWVEVLKQLNGFYSGDIVIVGSADEKAMADTVASQADGAAIINMAGKTTLSELFKIIGSAELLIGADSAPVHMAALTNTTVLNLSSKAVNFWETGPVTAGSRILYADNMADIRSQAVVEEAMGILSGLDSRHACAIRKSRLEGFQLLVPDLDSFSWRLIESLYTGTEFPPIETKEDGLAFQRLFELAELALQQLSRWDQPAARPVAARILNEVDQMLAAIPQLNQRVEPAVQWFETQRLRIPPGDAEATLIATKKAFEDLIWVSAVYRGFTTPDVDGPNAAKLARACAVEIREWNFAQISENFQALVSTLHELARHSTKVGPHLSRLNSALERKDFVELADHLEWVLAPELETFNQEVVS